MSFPHTMRLFSNNSYNSFTMLLSNFNSNSFPRTCYPSVEHNTCTVFSLELLSSRNTFALFYTLNYCITLIVPVALSRYTMLFSSINIYGFMLFLNSIHTVLFPCTLLLSIIIQIGLSPYTIVIYSFNTYSFLAKHCVVV